MTVNTIPARPGLPTSPDGRESLWLNRTWTRSARTRSAGRRGWEQRNALKFVPAIQGLEDRKLLSGTPPVASDGSVSTVHDHSISGCLYSSDTEDDPVTVSLAGDASHGTVSVNSDGSFIYTPDPAFVGQDSFTFVARDQDGSRSPATETIVAKKVANTGTVANDWQGIRNSYQAGENDCTISIAEVRGMVGGNQPIQIDPDAND